MVAERQPAELQVKHVVLIVPVEKYGISETFGDPVESQNQTPITNYGGAINFGATEDRRRQASYYRNTQPRRR